METVKKKEFVALRYTGYTEGKIFDSNVAEDLKQLDPKAKAEDKIVIVGEGMLVAGLDKALEGKELGKQYTIELTTQEAFGVRNRNLVKIVPTKAFHNQKVDPQPGMVFALDDNLAKVLAVSGGRVTLDLNHPLAGKPVKYTFTVERKVTDDKEKYATLFATFFRMVPEFEVTDKEVIVKGPKGFEMFITALQDKFKEFVDKPMKFQEIEMKHDPAHDHNHEGHDHEGHDHSHHDHDHSHDHSHDHKH